jgi:ATP-dependent helicase/nuclease subunit B
MKSAVISGHILQNLLACIEAAVASLRVADPFRPVHVLVPNHVLGTLLSRSLFRDTGYLGIYCELPHEFAWRLASKTCLVEGLLPVPEEVDLAIVLTAGAHAVDQEGTPDYLRRAVTMPGFAPAALRTLRDVGAADVGPDALDSYAPHSPDSDKLRVMARIARAQQTAVAAAGLVDREALYRRAAASLTTADCPGVVLVGPPPPSRGFESLAARLYELQACAWVSWPATEGIAPRHDAARAAFGARTGLAHATYVEPAANSANRGQAPSALERLQKLLFVEGMQEQPAEPDDSLRFLSAPGESLEAVEIARLILQEAARGVRFQEMAVLLHEPAAYSSHLASAFDRAGIPAFFLEGVPRIDPAARALGLLLDLLDANLDRAQVAEFLTTARIPYRSFLGEDARISPARWDRLSARAGILSGLLHWRKGLKAAREKAEEREYDDEIALTDALEKTIERLAADLAGFPNGGGWRDFLAPTLTLLERWIERGQLTAERLERVIGPLDRFAPTPTREQFLARVKEIIASQVYREGSLADGRVFVGPTGVAGGLSFRVVFVPGMVERRFPSVARPDPLLLDEERQALSPALRTTVDAQEQERLRFIEACGAAGERLVLSYPRVDGQTGKERVPSSFLLRAARAVLGRRVSADNLSRLASTGETSLGRPYPRQADLAVDLVERDLALAASGGRGAARHLLTEVPNVARALEAERASWVPELTVWDGLVDTKASADAVSRLRLNGREVSASEVEALGACPYRHFLKVGLRLRKWEEPERAYSIAAMDSGSIMHAVLERLFAELKQKNQLPLTEERLPKAKARAAKLIDEEFQAFADAGGVIHPALMNAVRDLMRADVDDLLEREVKEKSEFVPDQFERTFEKVPFEFAPGRSLSFHGVMDRLDVAANPKRVRVIDYKTGYFDWKADDQFKGGRKVQLAIYNLAASAA